MFLVALFCVLMLHFSETKELVGPKQVTGIKEGELSIKFMYATKPSANKYARKFFCKVVGKSCNTIVSTNDFVMDDFRNRATIDDNREEGFFTVTLSYLKLEDVGTYRGGFGNNNNIAVQVNVAVTEDSTFPREAQVLFGPVRSTVTFQCDFDSEYSTHRKYLCKHDKHGCKDIIDDEGVTADSHKGRILLTKGEKAANFLVKLIQLTRGDGGSYSCGVGKYGGEGPSTEFVLSINEEAEVSLGSRLLPTSLGGSISAQCPYNPKKNFTTKYWCKLDAPNCSPIIQTNGFVKDSYEGKVLLHDDPVNGILQVLMNGITKEDEGWFWCVMTDGQNDQTSTVQVKIDEENKGGLTADTLVSAIIGQQVTFTCKSSCKNDPFDIYWCKWSNNGCTPVKTEDSKENGQSSSCQIRELTHTINSVTKQDEGTYWCLVDKSGNFGETRSLKLIVVENGDAGFVPESNPRGRMAENITPPPSSEDTKNNHALPIGLSVCAVILVVAAVFLIVKLRQKKNSDLVSVGSYRTNISMTELEDPPHIGKDNPVVVDSQETVISSTEDGKKTNKKGSKEDLSYSSFLIHSDGKPNEDAAM
ncbi:polymeric immunoglobulin receptor-like isoform 1-T2 [Discoglossus pictus]